MASSSSSSPSVLNIQEKYDVFLSFRGEDSRDNFTSHLYGALCNKQIQTFIDEDGLQRGEYISTALFKAIEESKISVIIFSQNYASSTWCLEELVKILECRERNNRIVIPVFYHVSPSDVRKQTGSIGDAFVNHEKRVDKIPKEQVQRWKDALTKASNLSGFVSTDFKSEFELVKQIVNDILEKLKTKSSVSSYPKSLFGMEEHVRQIESLLSKHRGIVICGMGGIGKTTIAEVVYQNVSSQFGGRSFIPNVREDEEKKGLVRLKEQLLSDILDNKNLTLQTPNIIDPFILERVKHKKVLLVLDDVSDQRHLQSLIGGLEFGLGSKVIITTRNRKLCCAYEESVIYDVEELNSMDAFQLICHHAFKQNPQIQYLRELLKKIVDHVGGHPLSLEVLGSSLYGQDEKHWESMVQSILKGDSNHVIYNSLRISYNRLDPEEQEIFLDIACFFKGWDYNHITKILASCYQGPIHRLNFLVDKSLITKTSCNTIQMHDLLQETGWDIVRQESPNVPGKRSRLWDKDAFEVLKNNTGTDAIQSLFLDSSKITDIDLSPDAFQKMPNLKFLNFCRPSFNGVNVSCLNFFQNKLEKLTHLPNELRCLHWYGCPLKELPSSFNPESLVDLALPQSKLKKLWTGRKHPSKLTYIDLHDSEWLTNFLDLSDAVDIEHLGKLERIGHRNSESQIGSPNLSDAINPKDKNVQYSRGGYSYHRRCSYPVRFCYLCPQGPSNNIHFESLSFFNLSNCKNLKKFPQIPKNIEYLNLSSTAIEEVPSFTQDLNELHTLELINCKNLKSFSRNHFISPISIDLSGCISLTQFPQISGNVEKLCLDETAIEEVPSSIECLTEMNYLCMMNCTSLKHFSIAICKLKSLRVLILSGCSRLESFPEVLEKMESLITLDLNGASSLKELPASIGNLERLEHLNLTYCKDLRSIPGSICELRFLTELSVCGCSKLDKLPENINCTNIQASKSALTRLPSSIGSWRKTVELRLDFCKLTEIPEDICLLSSLYLLDLSGNKFKSLPASMKQLSGLQHLYLSHCNMLQSLPEFSSDLRSLDAENCKQLQSLPEFPLSDFKEVDASKLQKIFRSDIYTEDFFCYKFLNCPKLNGNASIKFLADAQLRFQSLAAAALKRHDKMSYGNVYEVCIQFCLPGSEIPYWMSYQSSGSSLSINLPQDWYNRSFIGFALCAIIEYKKDDCGYCSNFNCEYNFETSYGEKVEFRCQLPRPTFDCKDMLVKMDYVVIAYDPCCDARLLEGHYTTASFTFRSDVLDFSVKKCGAQPLYSQPSEAQSNIFQDFDANSSGRKHKRVNSLTTRQDFDANSSRRKRRRANRRNRKRANAYQNFQAALVFTRVSSSDFKEVDASEHKIASDFSFERVAQQAVIAATAAVDVLHLAKGKAREAEQFH